MLWHAANKQPLRSQHAGAPTERQGNEVQYHSTVIPIRFIIVIIIIAHSADTFEHRSSLLRTGRCSSHAYADGTRRAAS